MGRIRKRCRQFIRALFSGMEAQDHDFVDEFLDENEKRLFYLTDPAIQKHSVNVARTILSRYCGSKPDLELLVKTSLLHDVGKTKGTFRLVDRVLYVLSCRMSPKVTEIIASQKNSGLFQKLRKAFYIHLHHERIGAELLAINGISKEIVFLVANHHDRSMAGNSEFLSLLIEADEVN